MKERATRDAFGDELLELGEAYPQLYVVDCDISKSTKTTAFAARYPERHINVGIAEQNAAGVAAGLAAAGKIPFISTYAVFGSMRMLEQLRQSVCYPNLPVKVACSHGGLTPANDGGSHQGIEDMGLVSTIPNMAVVMPADYFAARVLVRAAAARPGPVYLRFTRDPVPVIYDAQESFEIGKGKVLREGGDVTLLAIGDAVAIALDAARLLEGGGISARVADLHTLKPLDRELVADCLNTTGAVVTVEDHTILHGLGDTVCAVCAETGTGRVVRVGIADRFGESGPYHELLKAHGITPQEVARRAADLVNQRGWAR